MRFLSDKDLERDGSLDFEDLEGERGLNGLLW